MPNRRRISSGTVTRPLLVIFTSLFTDPSHCYTLPQSWLGYRFTHVGAPKFHGVGGSDSDFRVSLCYCLGLAASCFILSSVHGGTIPTCRA